MARYRLSTPHTVTPSMNISTLTLIAVTFLLSSSFSNAAVIMTAPTSSSTGSLQITEDITFNITTAGPVRYLVFDEWVSSSDGSLTGTPNPAPPVPAIPITFSLNGGADTTAGPFINLIDNVDTTLLSITPLDGVFLFGTNIAVTSGDSLVIRAGTFTLPLVANFNPATTQTFTGNTFLTTPTGLALTGSTPVPEPSTGLLVGLMSVILFSYRKRSCKIS